MRTAIAALAALLAAPAAAQDVTIVSVAGDCERLVYDGADHTGECPDRMLQMAYPDGRVGFYAASGDVIFTISGYDGPKPDENTQLHDIDSIILGRSGSDPVRQGASGLCSYSNPYRGPMTISCQGTAEDGSSFLMVFRTDGSEPEVMGR